MPADPIIVAASLCTALILGGMAFFAFVYAPLVFRKLPADVAGGFIREVFPVYYRVLAALSVLAAALLWRRWEGVVLACVAALFLFSLLWLMPRINAARDAGRTGAADAGRSFARLHRASVLINGAQLIAVLLAFVGLVG
jgi:hypothetical protein